MSKYHDDNSYSNLPGQLAFAVKRYRRLEPAARGFWGWYYRHFGQGKAWEVRLTEHLQVGDSCAARVISVEPLLVAAYSNDLDCVTMLRFPLWLVEAHALRIEDRLLTINTYERPSGLKTYDTGGRCASDLVLGPENTGWLANLYPVIADFFSDDRQKIAQRKSQIPEEDWRRCLYMGWDYRERFPKRWRNGSPIWSWAPVR